MKRNLINELIQWKNSSRRKPLLLQGARQVGKTYLLKEFGNSQYENLFYFNFEENEEISNIFQKNLSPANILEQLSAFSAQKINTEKGLIFFDEIQLCPKAITSLKYFYEDRPDIHIVAAGSLLGVTLGKKISFPVGKVNFKTLYPLNFKEFLLATDESEILKTLNRLESINAIPEILHNKLIELYKKYLFIGGMPEVVNYYCLNRDFEGTREIQKEILESYKRDFSKYADSNETIKITEIWNGIPRVLSKENKKFSYSEIKKGSRASQYRSAIEWLKGAGLIYIVNNCTKAALPLNGYMKENKFKIFLFDTGLLGAMLNIHSRVLISQDKIFSEYQGAFIENYSATELKSNGFDQLFYWTSKSDAEVDFIIDFENNIIPIEVKSGMNRNIKSLRSFSDKYNPKYIFRISPRNFIINNDFVNIPLYAAGFLLNFVKMLDFNSGRYNT